MVKGALKISFFIAIFLVSGIVVQSSSTSEASPGFLNGVFFADFDRDGVLDHNEDTLAATNYPANGVVVEAYDSTGATATCAVTGTSYSCGVAALAGPFRLEFTLDAADIALGYTESFGFGDVQIANDGDTVNFGFVPPSACPTSGSGFEGNANSAAGKLWTTCFIGGYRDDPNVTATDVLVGVNYDDRGTAYIGGPLTQFPVEKIGHKDGGVGAADSGDDNSSLGAVWGIAYDEWSSTLFSSAVLMRHYDLGARGVDGLYWVSYPSGTWNSVDLNTLGGPSYGVEPAGRDLNQPSIDAGIFADVAKTGIGDIDVTPDGQTLLVANLDARAIMFYSLATGTPIYQGNLSVANPGCADTTNTDDYQIWATNAVNSDKALIGVTCTAQNSTNQDPTNTDFYLDLESHVVEVNFADPSAPTQGASLLTVPLAYERGCGNTTSCVGSGTFGPWKDTWDPDRLKARATYTDAGEQQPILSDIELLDDGSMVLGYVNRFSLQHASDQYQPDPSDTEIYRTYISGELLHVCNTTGDPENVSWVIEGQTTDCDPTSRIVWPNEGTNIQDGGGGPYDTRSEWYWQDRKGLDDGRDTHNETSQGGLYYKPYSNEIVVSVMDPETFGSGGLGVISTLPNETVDGSPIEFFSGQYQSTLDDENPGKGASIGDVEGCAIPMEIGNFVWLDGDQDGAQDPGESALAGVTVTLFAADGTTVLAVTTTDANGYYVFNSGHGVNANTTYVIDFDVTTTTSTLPGGVAASTLLATVVDSGEGTNPDLNDSDITGTTVTVTTGIIGQNNHSIDAGFVVPVTLRLGNLIFHDANNNGTFDAGEDGIEATTVELWEDTDGTGTFDPVNDTLVATQVTDAAGKYWFEGLMPEDYFVALPTAGNTAVTIDSTTGVDLADLYSSTAQGLTNATAGSFEPTTDSNADNDDDGRDLGNAAIPTGYITMSSLITLAEATEPTSEATTGANAGADETEANAQTGSITPDDNSSNLTVDFGFYALPDVAINKLVDGTDADTVFTDAEVIDIPPAAGTTAFQYQISVTNQSTLMPGNAIVLTDYVPEGIRVTGVASVSAGSVPTVFPVTGTSPFGTDIITWNVGTLAAGASATLVLDAELRDADVATFTANSLASNKLNQNVSQITAMTEDDTDSVVNSLTIADPSTFAATGSQDDEDDAFVFMPPMLGDYVWNDTDNDGIQDGGEPGINGVTVHLRIDDDGTPGPSAGDSTFATTTTMNNGTSDGFYVFGNLTAGVDYWVEFDHSSSALATYVPTTQGPATDPLDATDSDGSVADGWTEIHTLSPSEIRLTVDQGYVSLLSIGNLIWEDRNNNGSVDAGEPGLSGVTVELYVDTDDSGTYTVGDTLVTQTGSNSATPGEAVTDANGNWTFSGLLPEDYVVRIPDINGDTSMTFVSSTGNTNVLTSVTGSSEPAPDVDTDTDDNDDNGQADTGVTHVTNAVTLAYNTEPTTDGDTNTYTNYSVDLGFFKPFSLGNRVWLDNGSGGGTTNNGIQDGTEAGISSVTVNLYAASDTAFTTILATQATDASGYYRFDNLTPGDYVVEVVATGLPASVQSSTRAATAASPDQYDHGVNTTNIHGNFVSHTVTLAHSTLPTDETDITTGNGAESPYGDAQSHLAVDFGFVQVSDVSVDKQVDSSIYTLGTTDTRTYTLHVTNNGPLDAAGISVVDALPAAGVSFTSWTCTISTPGTGTLTEACANASGSGAINETVTLNNGGVATYSVTADFAGSVTGTVSNVVTVALPSALVQSPTDLPDTDTVDVDPQLQTPSVTIEKQLYEGHDSGAQCTTAAAVDELVIVDKTKADKDITYCFTVTNNGSTHLSPVTLSDPTLGITDSDMTQLAASDPIPLAPGDTVYYYYNTTTNTSVDNTATVTGTPVLPDGSATGQPNVTDEDSQALLIYVFDPPYGEKTGRLDGGQSIITWDMVWINDSAYQANGVIITDEPPVDTTYHGNLNCSPQGTSVVHSCTYEAPSTSYPLGRVIVTADISPDPGITDPVDADNEVIITFDVIIDNPDIEQTYENQADIEYQGILGVSDDPTTAGPSDPAVVSIGTETDLSPTGQGALLFAATGVAVSLIAVGVRRGARR